MFNMNEPSLKTLLSRIAVKVSAAESARDCNRLGILMRWIETRHYASVADYEQGQVYYDRCYRALRAINDAERAALTGAAAGVSE